MDNHRTTAGVVTLNSPLLSNDLPLLSDLHDNMGANNNFKYVSKGGNLSSSLNSRKSHIGHEHGHANGVDVNLYFTGIHEPLDDGPRRTSKTRFGSKGSDSDSDSVTVSASESVSASGTRNNRILKLEEMEDNSDEEEFRVASLWQEAEGVMGHKFSDVCRVLQVYGIGEGEMDSETEEGQLWRMVQGDAPYTLNLV